MPIKDILVIGAGGFTFGLEDTKNFYTYVDIDPSLEEVATTYFLKQALSENKKFIPEAAQSFVNFDKKKYDVILLDAFNGDTTLPEDLVTVEFFKSIKDKIKPNGIIAINFIVSPTYRDPMSRNLENTLREIFPYIVRENVREFDIWNQNPNIRNNVLYYYVHHVNDDKEIKERAIYTRDKNRIFFDKPQKRE
jgi:spermidine synthase